MLRASVLSTCAASERPIYLRCERVSYLPALLPGFGHAVAIMADAPAGMGLADADMPTVNLQSLGPEIEAKEAGIVQDAEYCVRDRPQRPGDLGLGGGDPSIANQQSSQRTVEAKVADTCADGDSSTQDLPENIHRKGFAASITLLDKLIEEQLCKLKSGEPLSDEWFVPFPINARSEQYASSEMLRLWRACLAAKPPNGVSPTIEQEAILRRALLWWVALRSRPDWWEEKSESDNRVRTAVKLNQHDVSMYRCRRSHVVANVILQHFHGKNAKYSFPLPQNDAFSLPLTKKALKFPLLCAACEEVTAVGDEEFGKMLKEVQEHEDSSNQQGQSTRKSRRTSTDIQIESQCKVTNSLFWQLICVRASLRPCVEGKGLENMLQRDVASQLTTGVHWLRTNDSFRRLYAEAQKHQYCGFFGTQFVSPPSSSQLPAQNEERDEDTAAAARRRRKRNLKQKAKARRRRRKATDPGTDDAARTSVPNAASKNTHQLDSIVSFNHRPPLCPLCLGMMDKPHAEFRFHEDTLLRKTNAEAQADRNDDGGKRKTATAVQPAGGAARSGADRAGENATFSDGTYQRGSTQTLLLTVPHVTMLQLVIGFDVTILVQKVNEGASSVRPCVKWGGWC